MVNENPFLNPIYCLTKIWAIPWYPHRPWIKKRSVKLVKMQVRPRMHEDISLGRHRHPGSSSRADGPMDVPFERWDSWTMVIHPMLDMLGLLGESIFNGCVCVRVYTYIYIHTNTQTNKTKQNKTKKKQTNKQTNKTKNQTKTKQNKTDKNRQTDKRT